MLDFLFVVFSVLTLSSLFMIFAMINDLEAPPGASIFTVLLTLAFFIVAAFVFKINPKNSEEVIESSEITEDYVVQEYDKGLAVVANGESKRYDKFEKTELIRTKQFAVYKQVFFKSKAPEIKRIEFKIFDFKGNQL